MGKAAEKIRNWSAYNKALVKRGALNIWIEKETLASLVCQMCLREKWAPLSLCGCRHRVRSRNQTGGHIAFRKQGSQASELMSKCLVLNKMTALGMPQRSINNKIAA